VESRYPNISRVVMYGDNIQKILPVKIRDKISQLSPDFGYVDEIPTPVKLQISYLVAVKSSKS
jgi:hypothetical protein